MVYVILFGIVILVLIARSINFIFGSGMVIYKGSGMSPTIRDGNIVMFKRINLKRKLKEGKLYVFCVPGIKKGFETRFEKSRLCVKRLDRILPNGKLYFLGDNASRSCDSRYFGAVERERVVGVVIRCYLFPPPYVLKKEGYEPGKQNEWTAYKRTLQKFGEDKHKKKRT